MGKESTKVLTPGSHHFPPILAADRAANGGSPVVLEMAKDTADDEEDTRRESGESGDVNADVAHWHGSALYRYGWTICGPRAKTSALETLR